jgi:transposase
MDACLYASDLNDEEWALLAPLIPRSHPAGRRQTYPLRRIVEAIFYLLRTGAQWRLLPHEYPPRGAVFYHYAQWRKNGTWEQVTRVLRESYRCTTGRAPQPSAAIIDSQSVKTSEPAFPGWADCRLRREPDFGLLSKCVVGIGGAADGRGGG